MDVAKAIALGADGVVIGTAELVAVECVRCGNCESGRGCARGIATTDPELGYMISEEYTEQRLVNMYMAWRKQWCELLRHVRHEKHTRARRAAPICWSISIIWMRRKENNTSPPRGSLYDLRK
jgi:glutamate synthase domain-containing protein 2